MLIALLGAGQTFAREAPPGYLEFVTKTDGRWTVRRISGEPGTPIPGIEGRWGDVVRHQYSKISAFSCDQRVLFLLNRGGEPELLFLDAATLAPLDYRPPLTITEMRWHPRRPDTAIFTSGNALGLWNVATGEHQILARFEGRDNLGIGPWEGNPSDDGRWIALASGPAESAKVFVYDLERRLGGPDIAHGFASLDFASVSASGRYVVVSGVDAGGNPDRTAVFTREGKPVGTPWREYGRPSHFDLTLDARGDDIAVGVSKSQPDEGSLIARRLRDGKVTRLTSAGYVGHTSTRNVGARGFAVASFAPDAAAWGPYSDQVLRVETRGRDHIEVIARMHARPTDYWAQPQPTVSPLGNAVLWASNWGQGPVAAYLARPPVPPDRPGPPPC